MAWRGYGAGFVVAAGGALGVVLGLTACGESNVVFATSGAGAQAGGGPGTGGSAGEGVASSSGQGGALPCGQDCSQIPAPPCFEGVCDPDTNTCVTVSLPAGAACEDGAFCTTNDRCELDGSCLGVINDCGLMPSTCQTVSCNETTDSCAVVTSANGTPCTADLCTVNALCFNSACVGQPKDCSMTPLPNQCHVAQCDLADGMCKAQPGNQGDPCTDPNALCTVGKTCNAGSCVGGSPMDCSALSVGCYAGVCNSGNGQCIQQPLMSGQPCAANTDECNQGTCNGMGSCLPVPINNGMSCDDGMSCTILTTCNNGICGGGLSSVVVYFAEDFSSNGAGWTLGTEWQMGAATASTGQVYGNPDPANDHTPTADDRVAGAVIGGNVSISLHAYYWIVSPVVDTSGATTLVLEFWRWLNSDYAPWMTNRVEVFNGATWVTIWQSGGPPGVTDSSWLKQTFDVSAYKNANMQVRFGHTVGQSTAFTVSGWNLDDVVLASGACN